jgi:hypothetical protein
MPRSSFEANRSSTKTDLVLVLGFQTFEIFLKNFFSKIFGPRPGIVIADAQNVFTNHWSPS